MSQWVLRAVAFLCGLSIALPVLAASTINTQQPAQNAPYNAAPIRENFGAAANDINALQRMNLGTSPPSSPSYGTLWLRQPTSGTTYTLNIWIASAATWAPIARIDGATGYWEPPVGGGILPSLISDATTDLGSVPNAALYVTGSQSVASFGASAPPGQLKFLIFTDAATLIYNPTYMILPGNSNFTAGANNTAIMLSLGQGKWRMISSGSGGSGSCDIFTATTSGCVPASGGGTVNFLRADGTWVPAGGDTSFTIAAGFTNTVGTLNIGNQTITNNSTLSEQFWITRKSGSYTVNADNGGTSDTGVLLVSAAPSITFAAPNPSAATKGNSYQFGTDGTNGFTVTTVGGAATIYGCPGPDTGVTSFTFGATDIQIVDDGVNYKCTSGAAISSLTCSVGTPNTIIKFITGTTCGDSRITDDGTTITVPSADLRLPSMPTSDPSVSDQVWNYNGYVVFSGFTPPAGSGCGTGTTNTVLKFTDGAGGVCGDSHITDDGTDIVATAGTPGGGLAGGSFTALGGAGEGAAAGGGIVATAGNGGASGSGGGVVITAGDGTAGGAVSLTGGGASTASSAGAITVGGGANSASGSGGAAILFGGDSATGNGGAVTITSGNGGANAGDISITAGNGGAVATDANGGNISIIASAGTGTGDGGGVSLGGGTGDNSNGGSIALTPARTFDTQSAVPGDGGHSDGVVALTAHLRGSSGGSWRGTISTCGGGTPAFSSGSDTDTVGKITVGSGAVTACTLTFARSFNAVNDSGAWAPPKCFATNFGPTPNAISISAVSITAVTFTFAADINTTGGAFQYWCVQ